MSIITTDLLLKIREHYALNWYGTHGIYHWCRVYENGVRLAQQVGVNAKIVKIFSVMHDSQRWTEHFDPEHGPRAAKLVLKLRKYIPLDDDELGLLTIACSLHTSVKSHENLTIASCLDSDRLDLGRTGNTPKPDLLCTPFAKLPETIDWALQRSMENSLPENVFGIVGYQNR